MTGDPKIPESEKPEPQPLTRRQRARREAVVGAISGVLWGLALWQYFDGVGSPMPWIVPLALFFAMVFYQNEWMD